MSVAPLRRQCPHHAPMRDGDISTFLCGVCGEPVPHGSYPSRASSLFGSSQNMQAQMAASRNAYIQASKAELHNRLGAMARQADLTGVSGLVIEMFQHPPSQLTQDQIYERDARKELEDYLGPLPDVVLIDIRTIE